MEAVLTLGEVLVFGNRLCRDLGLGLHQGHVPAALCCSPVGCAAVETFPGFVCKTPGLAEFGCTCVCIGAVLCVYAE